MIVKDAILGDFYIKVTDLQFLILGYLETADLYIYMYGIDIDKPNYLTKSVEKCVIHRDLNFLFSLDRSFFISKWNLARTYTSVLIQNKNILINNCFSLDCIKAYKKSYVRRVFSSGNKTLIVCCFVWFRAEAFLQSSRLLINILRRRLNTLLFYFKCFLIPNDSYSNYLILSSVLNYLEGFKFIFQIIRDIPTISQTIEICIEIFTRKGNWRAIQYILEVTNRVTRVVAKVLDASKHYDSVFIIKCLNRSEIRGDLTNCPRISQYMTE